MNSKKKKDEIIVFDIETGLIPNVKKEKLQEEIRKLKISVIGAYSYIKDEYLFFTEENIHDFFELLKNASKIVGFNVIDFDYEVLRKYGLPNNLIDKTVDLFDLIKKETGNWYSLDKLSQENLGRGKLYQGKELATMKGVDLYNGCKADVQNTKELFDLWKNGQLKYDKRRWYKNTHTIEDESGFELLGIDKCPYCGYDFFFVERVEEDLTDCTDGQIAEYEAGNWGTVICPNCNKQIDFD
ncbi:MAG: hypothetical protein PQ964_03375 [Methanobacteriaceae archaeon]|jgi:hypothetical protein